MLRVRIDFGTHYETRYEGNDHFDKSTLDELLDIEDETDRTPNHLVQKVRDYYVKHGFLDAEVKPRDARHGEAIPSTTSSSTSSSSSASSSRRARTRASAKPT